MHCLWEIIDNAVDEALGGHCTRVDVTLHPDGSAEIHDDGRGVPVDKEPKTGLSGVEVVFTKLHAGGKFGGGSYTATGGLHGVGCSVVNALSARLDVEVDRSPATQAMSFQRGVPGVFAEDGPTGPLRAEVGPAQGPPGQEGRDRHPRAVLARPAGLHPGRDLRLGRAGHARSPDLVHRARAPAHAHRPAGRRAGRGVVPARRRDHRVLRVPQPRRAGQRGTAAAGPGLLHRDGAAARRQGAHDPPGRRAGAGRGRGRALGDRLRDRAALLRQRDLHAQGRHPRGRLRGRRSPRRSTT